MHWFTGPRRTIEEADSEKSGETVPHELVYAPPAKNT